MVQLVFIGPGYLADKGHSHVFTAAAHSEEPCILIHLTVSPADKALAQNTIKQC